MNAPVRIHRRNETVHQRLRRLARERAGTPHHEDYIDGNPSGEMRVRSMVELKKNEPFPDETALTRIAEQQVLRAKEWTGKEWTYTIQNLNPPWKKPHWTLELTQVE